MKPQSAEILAQVGGFASGLIKRADTPEHAVVVASALIQAAEMILKATGGAKHAAMQFYAAADRCATE